MFYTAKKYFSYVSSDILLADRRLSAFIGGSNFFSALCLCIPLPKV